MINTLGKICLMPPCFLDLVEKKKKENKTKGSSHSPGFGLKLSINCLLLSE